MVESRTGPPRSERRVIQSNVKIVAGISNINADASPVFPSRTPQQ